MIISIYSSKGSAGKTPISTNIALEYDFCIGTNEAFHVYDFIFPKNRIIAINTEDSFPNTIKEQGINIVYDLAGSISKSSNSITSAITMSDVVIVPIYNEFKSLVAGINTINQLLKYNQNIVVVATKLKKKNKETFKNDWSKSIDFLNIQNTVNTKINKKIAIVPLKYSAVFDNIFEEKMSIKDLMKASGLNKYNYNVVNEQFNQIYKLIGLKK